MVLTQMLSIQGGFVIPLSLDEIEQNKNKYHDFYTGRNVWHFQQEGSYTGIVIEVIY